MTQAQAQAQAQAQSQAQLPADAPEKVQIQLRSKLQRPGFSLDVNLNIPGRGVTAIHGPSGSGKTTCLRILAGLEPQAQGSVVVNGSVWQDSDRHLFLPVHQRAVGYVFQEASLFEHLTIEQNLKFGHQRTPKAERRHGWDHGLTLLGIDHLLSRKPHELSGGERQRVAIARALAASPRVLLMDEPLAALDAQRKAEIIPWLEQLHAQIDMPVVYVTHSVEEIVHLADHMVVLDHGREIASGPAIELLTRPDLPLVHGDDASALIQATTALADPTCDSAGLCCLRFSGGTLWMPSTSTPNSTKSQPAEKPVRVRIRARDVSISLQRPEHTSVLNILGAVIERVQEDGPGQVMVRLRVGEGNKAAILLSRISQVSAHRLALAPGMAVFAQIKGVAMVR